MKSASLPKRRGSNPKLGFVTVETVERGWKEKTLVAYEPERWLQQDVDGSRAINFYCILRIKV